MTGLWTPTDWNAEAALRITYIKWLVQHRLDPVTLRMTAIPDLCASEVMRWFQQTGVMFVNSLESETPATHEVSYEYWREYIHPGQGITQNKYEQISNN